MECRRKPAQGRTLRKKISVVVTVKNEGEAIRRLLDSLCAQTRQPDEVVAVDGGSTDDTLEVLKEYAVRLPLQVLVREGAKISQGRNTAIAAAEGEIIASTDAGVRLSTNWLEALVKPFEGPNPPQVVSGFFLPDPHTVFETAMAATVLPTLYEINFQRRFRRFLPSSRSVAFTKEAWEKVGGYPRWLDYSEDLIFDLRLLEEGFRFAFVPIAIAHFRPRSSLKSFWIQYYRYARGDGKAVILRGRHLTRYLTYFLAIPLLVVLGLLHSPFWWLVLALGTAAVLWTPYKRLLPMIANLGFGDKLRAIALVPIIRVIGDIAKMTGYPVGLLWRLKRHSSQEIRYT